MFATGFVGNLREMAGTIVGPEIEDQLEDFWALDSEGEIRGAFKYTGREFDDALPDSISQPLTTMQIPEYGLLGVPSV